MTTTAAPSLQPLPAAPRLRVDIWSDIACPWCYIGKRRFEAALARFPQASEVDVVWRSFELDPAAPAARAQNVRDALAVKYGRSSEQAQAMLDSMTENAAGEGLTYDFARVVGGNTFLAHQLVHLGAQHGLQDAVKERLLRAYFSEGATLSDLETLVALGAEVGLDADEARAALAAGTYARAVRQDEAQAQAYGISGVPFFVLGGKYGVNGAQSPETLLAALTQTWQEAQPQGLQTFGDAPADGCEDGQCAVPQS